MTQQTPQDDTGADDAQDNEKIIVVDGTDVLDALPKTTIAKFDPIKAVLAKIEEELKGYTPDLSTKEGEKKARDIRRRLVKTRTGAKNLYEALNAPMLKAQRDARAAVLLITATVEGYEVPLDAAIKAKDEERAAEEARLAGIEKERIATIRGRIDVIESLPARALEMSIEDLSALLGDVEAMDISEERFAEFLAEAKAKTTDVNRQLTRMYDDKVAAEKQATELAYFQERERIAAANAEIRKKIAAISTFPMQAFGKTAEEIARLSTGFAAPSEKVFGDLLEEASEAWHTASQQLAMMLSTVRAQEEQASSAAAAREAAAEQLRQQVQTDAFDAERRDREAEEATKRAKQVADAKQFRAEESALAGPAAITLPEEPPEADESTMPGSDAAIDLLVEQGGEALVERTVAAIVEVSTAAYTESVDDSTGEILRHPVDLDQVNEETSALACAEALALSDERVGDVRVDTELTIEPDITASHVDAGILFAVAAHLNVDLETALARIAAMDLEALAADLKVPA